MKALIIQSHRLFLEALNSYVIVTQNEYELIVNTASSAGPILGETISLKISQKHVNHVDVNNVIYCPAIDLS